MSGSHSPESFKTHINFQLAGLHLFRKPSKVEAKAPMN
jgi:hypothetical protein